MTLQVLTPSRSRLRDSYRNLTLWTLQGWIAMFFIAAGYAKTFGDKFKTEVSTFGGHAYDGLMLAVNAMKVAGSTDKAKVRDALEATKAYVGADGVFNMSATDHMGLDLSAFRMLEVRNGSWALVN